MKVVFAGAAVVVTSVGSAHAGITVFQDRALFNAAAGNIVGLEDFESEAVGQTPLPRVFDSGLGFDIVSGTVPAFIQDVPPLFGLANTTPGGENFLQTSANFVSGSYSVEFDTGGEMTAFGFDITGWQPSQSTGGLSFTIFNGNQIVLDDFVAFNGDDFEATFWGWVADPGEVFTSVRVSIPQIFDISFGAQSDVVGFDQVVWVPSPGVVMPLAGGMLLAARRRRSS